MLPILALLPLVASLNITRYTSAPLVPSNLPPPSAASSCDEIIALFAKLGRSTVWKQISATPLEGSIQEPEGIVKIGDTFVVSGGVWTQRPVGYKNDNGTAIRINGTDRDVGSGYGMFWVYNKNGTRLAEIAYNELGDPEYHNGGIDYDGEHIWSAIAQYRPNTTATIYKVDPNDWERQNVIHVADHQGGIVHDKKEGRLYTNNWGSRNGSTWSTDPSKITTYPEFTAPLEVARNPSFFIDYQDAKWCGHPAALGGRPVMLASGIATIGSGNDTYTLGGIAVVDAETLQPYYEVPIALASQYGRRLTSNPFEIGVIDGKLRIWWLPDLELKPGKNVVLYEYEAQLDSPFQYGGTGGMSW